MSWVQHHEPCELIRFDFSTKENMKFSKNQKIEKEYEVILKATICPSLVQKVRNFSFVK